MQPYHRPHHRASVVKIDLFVSAFSAFVAALSFPSLCTAADPFKSLGVWVPALLTPRTGTIWVHGQVSSSFHGSTSTPDFTQKRNATWSVICAPKNNSNGFIIRLHVGKAISPSACMPIVYSILPSRSSLRLHTVRFIVSVYFHIELSITASVYIHTATEEAQFTFILVILVKNFDPCDTMMYAVHNL